MKYVLTLAMLVGLAPAQELLWERVGAPESHRFGWRLAVLGDVNADGHDDLITTVHAWSAREVPQLWTLSGKDGSTLRVRKEINIASEYGDLSAAGDVNGDGVPDYVVHYLLAVAQAKDVVEVASGKDDSAIWSVEKVYGTGFGEAILGDLDLDGDKKPDVVVVEPLAKPLPKVHAYSNQGKLLYTVSGTNSLVFGCFRNGQAIGKVGDVDQDGADDYIVGACRPGIGGAAVLLSGRTGKVLLVAGDQQPLDNIGFSMDGCGDLDLDGVPDFVVGSTPVFGTGVVLAFSSRTGKVLHRWVGSGWRFGRDFASDLASQGMDADQDGIPDIVVGARGLGAVLVFSGRDGRELHRVESGATKTEIGLWVAAFGPQPGNPSGLWAVPEPWHGHWYRNMNSSYRGRLRVFRGSPVGAGIYGTACRGTLQTQPRIGVRQEPHGGVKVHLSNAEPGTPAILLLGVSRTRWGSVGLPLGVGPLGYPGCDLQTSVELFFATTPTGTAGLLKGYTSIDLPRIAGGTQTVYAQWISTGTGTAAPGALSEALSLRL